MLKNRRLSKAASDVAMGSQKLILQSVMGAGRYFKARTTRAEGGNSQTCLCGESAPKTLKDRTHACPSCGLTGPRDQISAIIVQHSTFGTVPQLDSKKSSPGLGDLERAVKALKTRRGESKVKGSESCVDELHTAKPKAKASGKAVQSVKTRKRVKTVTSKLSVKRPAPRTSSERNTTGEAKAASVEVKTIGYVDSFNPWPIETKKRLLRERSLTKKEGNSGIHPKHPPSGG